MSKPRQAPNNFRSFSISALILMASLLGHVSATAAPAFSKSFSPDTIGPGSTSKLSFIINNEDPINGVTDLAFSDTVPAGVTIATPANASTSCTDGIITAPDGGSTITFTDGKIEAGNTCVISVDVTAEAEDESDTTYTNTSGDLTSSAGNSDAATADLIVDTSLPGFSKSFSPATVPLGSRSTLTFTIDNSANASFASFLFFTDNFPAGLVIADPANASNDCTSSVLTATPGADVVSLAGGLVPAGATCTVSVDVVGNAIGQLDNSSGELSSGSPAVSSGKANAALDVTGTTLSLVKSFLDDPVSPGSTVELEFTISNRDRSNEATGIAFTDSLETTLTDLEPAVMAPADPCGAGSGLSFAAGTLSFSNGTLAAGASCTFSASLAVPGTSAAGAYPNTTTAVSATIDGLTVTGNTASDTLFISNAPTLTKEFLEVGTLLPDPVINAGDDVVLRFTISNSITTFGATDIQFDDVFAELGNISATLPPDPACGAGSSVTFIPFNDPGPGGSNTPASLLLTGGSLAAGASCTFDVTLTIPADLSPGIYTNTTGPISATIDSVINTGKPASDSLTVIGAPSLSKAFTDDPVAPGAMVNLEFTLSHPADASGDATAITFTDDLATTTLAGLTATGLPLNNACNGTGIVSGSAGVLTLAGASLSPGESCTFSVALAVPATAAPGSYTNTTSGVGAVINGSAVTSAPAEDDLQIAGLTFSKEFLSNPVLPGAATTLRFSIENLHPTDDATITFFTDDLDAALSGLAPTATAPVDDCGGSLSGTTSLTYIGGGVLSGATCTIDVEVLVPAGAANGDYNNVTSFLSTSVGSINPATATLTVNDNLLQLTKSFTDDPVSPGDSVTLEFVLTNLDTQAATAVGFSDDLSAALSGLTFDSVLFDGCGGTVAGIASTEITVTGVSLPAGGSCTIRTSLSVPATAAPNIYTNTTSPVTGTIGGLTVTGDAASDELEIINLLLFSKTFDGPSTATGTAILTFTITNPGTSTATGIAFTDNLDAVLSGLVATSFPTSPPCGAGSSISGTSSLSFSGGELPPTGGMCSFDVEVTIPATATAGDFTNTTSDLLLNGLFVSPPATADLTVLSPPTFSKDFDADTVALNGPNTVSTLTFTIDNAASVLAAAALDFTDTFPAGMEIATPSNASSTCTGGTITAVSGANVISYTGGSVAAAASCTIEVDVISTSSGDKVNTSGDLSSSSGNSGTATDTLLVDAPPVIIAPADIVNFEALGVTSAVPLGTPTITDAVDGSGLTATPTPDGTSLLLGTTDITWTVTDSIGNTSTAQQSVTIVDTTPPALSVPADITVESTGFLTPVNLGTPTVTDLADPAPIITNDNPGPFLLGLTIVTWTATDASGNRAIATQRVTIEPCTDLSKLLCIYQNAQSQRFCDPITPSTTPGHYVIPTLFGTSWDTAYGHDSQINDIDELIESECLLDVE